MSRSAIAPDVWGEFASQQRLADARLLDHRVWARDEAIGRLLDGCVK